MFNLRPDISKSLNTHFILNNSDLFDFEISQMSYISFEKNMLITY